MPSSAFRHSMQTNTYVSAHPTMFGLVVIFAVLTICSADNYVEREILQIRAILTRQEREIKELRSENMVLRADVDKLNAEIERLRTGKDTSPGHDDEIRKKNNGEEETIQSQKLNMILDSNDKQIRHTRASPEPVAFYAYMSLSEPNPSLHHTLVFDVVKTNLGGGYNEYSGMFTAPSSGVYVFTWTIYTGYNGRTGFQIFVNHDIVDSTLGETDGVTNDYDSDSGTVAVSLNVHDNVYIRSYRVCTTYVISGPSERTSFAGWKLN